MLTNEHLLQAFEAIGAHDGVIYLSVPITSGLREIALMEELGISSEDLRRDYEARWRSEVIHLNELDARLHADRVRAMFPSYLIVDPSRMAVRGWEQADYNTFWVTVMDRFASELVAAPGWEYSKGARGEVSFALVLGRRVLDTDLHEITPEQVVEADLRAQSTLRERGWSKEALSSYLAPMDYIGRPQVHKGAASIAFEWLVQERRYQVKKFGVEADDDHTREGLDNDSWWWRQLTSYFHRSRVLGLDLPVGRQALAKFVATACGLLESTIRVYGPLPAPGVPSGEVRDNALEIEEP